MEKEPQNYYAGPENLDNRPQITKKIEVGCADDFWNLPDDCDYLDPEIIADYERYAREEKVKDEALLYSPFDPKKELANVRKLSVEEKKISTEEKIEIRAEKLNKYKENLIHQKEGIARVTKELRDTIESLPDESEENLLQKVHAMAPEYRFTQDQISLFKYVIEGYREKHTAVEKYRTMYPVDADLFEACFGKKPKGKIEVVKGPMTLFFRCFDFNDYAFLRFFSKHEGDENKIQPEDVIRANDSAGVALRDVKIEELAGVVTAENVRGNNPHYELVKGVEKTEEIHGNKCALFIYSQKGDINIEVKGVGVWQVKITERDGHGEPSHIQFLNLTEADTPPIFDVIRVEATEEMRLQGNSIGHLKSVSDESLHHNMIEYLRVGNKIYGNININNFHIEIEDQSTEGTVVRYTEDEYAMIPNEEQ
ncbi:MAG: hypothetical protein WCP15_04390 [bacterium]